MKKLTILILAIAMSVLVAGPTLSANSVPTLWGIDEDDDELFSIDDYTQIDGSAVLTSYGILKYDRDGVITDLTCDSSGAHIGSFTLDSDGVAYMALNCALDFEGTADDLDAPVLLKFDTADATTSGDNVVTVVGHIDIPGFDEPGNSDNISGLSFDPISGWLWALYRVHSDPTPDRLLVIDPTLVAPVIDLGTMTGLGQVVEDGEDLEFDELGNLYVTDNEDEHLYRVEFDTNALTAAIVDIVDANESGGLGVGSIKIEGLVWDPVRNQLVGSDDENNLFFIYDLTQDGNNSPLGSVPGLTDVEAMDIAIAVVLGRMTGGGRQLSIDGARVTKGLTLHCDITLSNNLEINWPGGNNWHLEKESLSSVECIDTILEQKPPPAPFDTFIAEAVGSLNDMPGSIIRFTFVDAGEPGRNDSGMIKIWAVGDDPDTDAPVLEVDDFLRGGNFQAHFDQPHK